MPEYPQPKLHPPHQALPESAPSLPAPEAYAELAVTSNFSFLRGASHPEELILQAAHLGYRALALTDTNSLAGVVRAHTAAQQAKFRFVVGTRLAFQDGWSLLVWPSDRAAYGRLCRLLTLGKTRGLKGEFHLSIADVQQASPGLYAAALLDDPASSEAAQAVRQLHDAFAERLSLAAACTYGADDQTHLNRLLELGQLLRVPLLATNHVHYHDPARRPLQDVLTCIRHRCTLHEAGFKLLANAERHLKSPAQMHRLFAACPQALRRGLDIAERCTFNLEELKYEYPHEIVPPGQTPLEYLAQLAWTGARQRYPAGLPEKIRALLERELALIGQLHFEAYFLSVHDVVQFARSRGILCQGRGSAANSAVCFCLGITSVDPTRIEVLFERFISAARGEPPDIDVDFEHERREEVIQYIYQKYGRERAGMTAEVITYRGRSAVRDVGKALGLSLDVVDAMAKRLDWWDSGTLTPEKIREIGLDPDDRTVRLVLELSGQLLGFPRHIGQHVGGMVMTHGPLCEMVPIENAAMENRTIIEWDKDDIDALGILKVDILALGMLTAIAKCLKLVNGYGGGGGGAIENRKSKIENPLQLHTIPPEDPAVYDMIQHADTVGVFQIESRAQMSMLPRLRPRCFYDLVIEVAIVRPGPIQGDMVHPYLRRRAGTEPVTYASDALRAVLAKTLGIPLFQEQAMRLAMVAAGFSAEEADRLRRAMAAWKRHGGIEPFREKIVAGMLGNGYTRAYAEQCFQQLRGFGAYGFPESHAASFALLVYVSAWLKRHHPAAFATALLNSQPMGFYMPAQLVRDAQSHGVPILPVDINASQWDCTLEPSGGGERSAGLWPARAAETAALRNVLPADASSAWGRNGPAMRLGFRLLKGLPQSEAARLVAARDLHGPFTSLEQLHHRAGLSRSALRLLAEGDAFGSLGLTRRQALWQVLKLRDQPPPLFSIAQTDEPAAPLPPMPLRQEVLTDYATAGLSLKRHPVSLVRDDLTRQRILTAAELKETPTGRWVRVAGLVLVRQRPGTAAGVVFVTLEDETGTANLIVRPHIYGRYRTVARQATLLCAEGRIERQGEVLHLLAQHLHDLSPLLLDCSVPSRDFH